MEIFDFINGMLHTHPDMLYQLEIAFRIQFWSLLILAVYFLSLPYREKIKKEKKRTLKRNQFLA
jgi:hypothetical protein